MRIWKGGKVEIVVVKHLFNVMKTLKNNSVVYKLLAGFTFDIYILRNVKMIEIGSSSLLQAKNKV